MPGEEDEFARGDGAYWARALRPKRERKYFQLVEAGRGGRPAGEGWMGVEGARGEGGGEVGCQMAPSTSRMGVSWGSRKKGGKVLIASRILQFVSLKFVKPMESRGGGGCYSTCGPRGSDPCIQEYPEKKNGPPTYLERYPPLFACL